MRVSRSLRSRPPCSRQPGSPSPPDDEPPPIAVLRVFSLSIRPEHPETTIPADRRLNDDFESSVHLRWATDPTAAIIAATAVLTVRFAATAADKEHGLRELFTDMVPAFRGGSHSIPHILQVRGPSRAPVVWMPPSSRSCAAGACSSGFDRNHLSLGQSLYRRCPSPSCVWRFQYASG